MCTGVVQCCILCTGAVKRCIQVLYNTAYCAQVLYSQVVLWLCHVGGLGLYTSSYSWDWLYEALVENWQSAHTAVLALHSIMLICLAVVVSRSVLHSYYGEYICSAQLSW